MSGNPEINRLQKKAKIGWAAFFQSENKNHRIHTEYMEKINAMRVALEGMGQILSDATTTPIHLQNELKELYEFSKKEVSCPICLEVLEINAIKFSTCSHKYCENCLNQLKAQPQPKCAICRRRIY
tara:strand:+ start:1039 stop:1416 length:378 start_codon:yes stop_codon:yes gene_type:complete